MNKFWFVLLFVPYLASAQDSERKTFPLHQETRDRFVACVARNAAIDLANIYVKKGMEASRKIFLLYKKKHLCINGEALVTYTKQVHHVEGKYGFMNVFQGDMSGVTIFSPQNWTIESAGCSPSEEENVCT